MLSKFDLQLVVLAIAHGVLPVSNLVYRQQHNFSNPSPNMKLKRQEEDWPDRSARARLDPTRCCT